LIKPTIITNVLKIDCFVEKDLQGLNLSDITNKNTIRQLSSDLTVFNDYAFRYYTLQFMSYYFLSYEYIFLSLFIPAYKKSDNLLTEDSDRFLQFGQEEIKSIIYFFQYLKDEIKFLKDRFKNLDFNNSLNDQTMEDEFVAHYLDLIDNENDIDEVLYFWSKHPNMT
jgi:hypothetical protein